MLEFNNDRLELSELGLTDEEIDGYFEFYADNFFDLKKIKGDN